MKTIFPEYNEKDVWKAQAFFLYSTKPKAQHLFIPPRGIYSYHARADEKLNSFDMGMSEKALFIFRVECLIPYLWESKNRHLDDSYVYTIVRSQTDSHELKKHSMLLIAFEQKYKHAMEWEI